MEKLRFGVLSTANIGVHKVIPAMQRGALTEVVAIASRELAAAQQVAEQLGIPKAYGSYEALLADPQVQAVYNPLPNHLHVPWSLKALQAGKHVLCEKPIGLSSVEGQQLVDAAARHAQLVVMEAFMYRHHPQWQEARRIVREGGIGPLRAIHTVFSYFNDDPANIRNLAEIGGGGLMDIGCYPISLSRFLFEREPSRVFGLVEYDPRFGTDRLSSVLLDFETGNSVFTCSTQAAPYQRVNILGEQGRVEIEIPFNAPPDRPCRMWWQQGSEVREMVFDVCDQYTLQGDAFAAAVLHQAPIATPIADAVANMKVIEAIVRAARSGAWERP